MEEFTQITLDEWEQWKEDIREKLEEAAGNFVYIGYRLKQIRDSGIYDGTADIFEFAYREYGLGKSTVSRFIAINEKFSEGGNSLELRKEFKKIGSSKLAEMLTLPDAECMMITERTTVREIRELKNFDRQEVEEEDEEELAPLEKCLIDYFKDKKEMLNEVMKAVYEDRYEEAAELMNPSGYATHKKGMCFMFMYDFNLGVKIKLLAQPQPVSMTWKDLLLDVYSIFANIYEGGEADVYGSYYGKSEKETKNEPKTEPKGEEQNVDKRQENQGFENSVATSQQTEEKGEENESEDVENAPELGENETKSEENASEEEENENDEEAAVVQDEESEEGSMKNDAEPVADDSDELTSGDVGSEEAAVDIEMKAGKYDQAIHELIDTIAYKSEKIADAMKEKDRKELSEYRKLRAAVYNMASDIEQLMKFIDLSEDKEEEEE